MTTLSQLVNELASELSRTDRVLELARFTNQTIRELHFEPRIGSAVYYADNFYEERLIPTTEEVLTWEIPKVSIFQQFYTARYNSVLDHMGRPRYAVGLRPGPRLEDEPCAYYRRRNMFSFKGFGGNNASVDIAWFQYPPSLEYYKPGCEPATYRESYGWSYGDAWQSITEREQAESLTTNWVLLRWADVIAEGVRAKHFKSISDDARARTSYSLYSQLRVGLFSSERFDRRGSTY